MFTVKLLVLSLFVAALGSAQTAPQSAAETTSQLDAVLESGVLRVCTTGDYKPFTFLDPETDAFEGIDIDMARDLAASLGVEARFVQTSWPTLMEDFTSGACDIAMGGISINLERQQQAFFSASYLTDGKTPITRCENVEQFSTLEQIDQPDVTVVVNPGGTNQEFADTLEQAEVVVFDDNVTIFDEILEGRADLMITDAVETLLQERERPGLCAVHPDEPFTYSEKGYLLPRGDVTWKAYVDQWLHLEQASGEFQEVYDAWLR